MAMMFDDSQTQHAVTQVAFDLAHLRQSGDAAFGGWMCDCSVSVCHSLAQAVGMKGWKMHMHQESIWDLFPWKPRTSGLKVGARCLDMRVCRMSKFTTCMVSIWFLKNRPRGVSSCFFWVVFCFPLLFMFGWGGDKLSFFTGIRRVGRMVAGSS